MNQSAKPEKNVVLPFRHSTSVKNFLDQIAAQENIPVSVLYRLVMNAGIKALYGKEVRNNQIVE